MGRLFGVVIAIFLLSQQLQISSSHSVLGIAKTAIKLVKTILDLAEFFNDDTSIEDLTTSIKTLNQEIQDDMALLTDTLKDLPSIIRLSLKKETLEGHFATIGQVFEEASRIKKEVDNGLIDRNSSKYHRFASKEKDIDHSVYEIRRILTDSDTTFVLRQNFTEASKKFDNVCKTGMSHLQLLDSLLGNLKAATAQYYLTKKFMYEFLELTGEDYTNSKKTLLQNVDLDYTIAVKKFKSIMSTASLELWTCDPPNSYNDTKRYNNETDPNFVELRIFSNYILNENNFVDAGPCPDKKCESITKLDKCSGSDWWWFCGKVRSCPGRLINCQQYSQVSDQSINICKNNDKNAYQRYLSIVKNDEHKENFKCSNEESKTTLHSIPFNGLNWYGEPCNYCNCLCEEDEYFVDDQLSVSDYESNKVVTGARFVMEEKTLRIQIQQAELLANGLINETTLEWKPMIPIAKYIRHKISYDEYKKFVLTPVINLEGRVVTAMSLYPEPINKTIRLFVGTHAFDFRTGLIEFQKYIYTDLKEKTGDLPMKKYDMTGRGASTQSKKENKPDSTDEQYVELSLSDFTKDGGQSVIPFIDTQDVTSNGPLSGASLYIRGQPGFGGFLGIKLFTYDFRKYVDDKSEIQESHD